MPNWTYNTLQVSGNKEFLADFIAKTIKRSNEEDDDSRDKFTFKELHPIPQALQGDYSPLPKLENETDQEFQARMLRNKFLYGACDWYDWCVANWGTKWDACYTELEQIEEDYIYIKFNTAWSPPLDWFYKVIPMYPDLEFDLIFDIEGDENCGILMGRKGDWELEMGTMFYTDEDGRMVEYNLKEHLWQYIDSQELITDEDFYPIDVNPFA
jgi:hypothetical protein